MRLSDTKPFLAHPFDCNKLKEECGIFGVNGVSDAANFVALGLHALQHRGQEAGGIVAFEENHGFNSARRFGYVRDNFTKESLMSTLPGHNAIGHVRYSTAGNKGHTAIRDVQPFFGEFAMGGCAITHANPHNWHQALRNKSITVMRELANSGGMLGFSIYPHHLKDGTNCTINSFCEMIAETADVMGIDNIGIGTDLCQNQPDSIVEWMRVGRWTKGIDYGEGTASNAGFPPMPSWYKGNKDFSNISNGLNSIGMTEIEISKVMGNNWLNFYDNNFGAVK